MPADEAAARAQRDLVRRGYDVISRAYRTDDGASHPSTGEDPGRYRHWAAELAGLLPARARVVDLGCGAGVPGTLALTERGLDVLGVDFSAVQLARAVRLVPAARFVQADMAEFQLRPASVDAVTALYSLIHLPLADQQALLPRIRAWLRPGGRLQAGGGRGLVDRDRALSGRGHVLGSCGHPGLSPVVPGGPARTGVAPVRSGGKRRSRPHSRHRCLTSTTGARDRARPRAAR